MRILWNTHSLFFFAYNISLISRLINHFWHCARKTCFLYGCFSFTVRHSVKGVQVRSFFWSIFTRIYTVNIPIQSKCRKIRTRKFLRRNCFSFWIILLSYVCGHRWLSFAVFLGGNNHPCIFVLSMKPRKRFASLPKGGSGLFRTLSNI